MVALAPRDFYVLLLQFFLDGVLKRCFRAFLERTPPQVAIFSLRDRAITLKRLRHKLYGWVGGVGRRGEFFKYFTLTPCAFQKVCAQIS